MHKPGPWAEIPPDEDSQRLALAAPLMYDALQELLSEIYEGSKEEVTSGALRKGEFALKMADGLPMTRFRHG